MKKLIVVSLSLVVTLFSCSSDDNASGGGDGGGLEANATYQVTFTPDFTEANFPTDYPANPSFSGIVVAVHAPDKSVFTEGLAASDALKVLAETGDSSDLIAFLASQGGTDSSDFIVVSLAPDGGPTQAQSVSVTIDPEKTSISFISSLSPSPDWFVGVDGQSMILNSTSLVTDLEVGLSPMDAGTDNGATYTSPDDPTVPQGTISVISSPPFTQGGLAPSIASLRFERTDL